MPAPIFHLISGLPRSVSPSSHAVECDGWIHLTGQFGRDLDAPDLPLPAGIEAQTRRSLMNMRRVLAGLDLDLGHVLAVRVYLTNFKRDYAAMNAVYAGYFPPGRRPARTCVGVSGLAKGALIEIDLVARRP